MKPWPAIAHSERLLVVVGPSGAGKDSVLAAWAALRGPRDPAVHTARRTITRAADAGGEAHEALSEADFAALRAAGALATAWQAHGLHYGVRHRELAPLASGAWVVLNGSREHLPVLRAQAPQCRVVEITAGAPVLAERLDRRAREDAAGRAARLQRRTLAAQADLTLVNEGALAEVAQALQRWWRAL